MATASHTGGSLRPLLGCTKQSNAGTLCYGHWTSTEHVIGSQGCHISSHNTKTQPHTYTPSEGSQLSELSRLSEGVLKGYLLAWRAAPSLACSCHFGAASRCFLGDNRMLPKTWLHSCSIGVDMSASTQELSDCSLEAELTSLLVVPVRPGPRVKL